MTNLQKLVNAYESVTATMVSRAMWEVEAFDILQVLLDSLKARIFYNLLCRGCNEELLDVVGLVLLEIPIGREHCAKNVVLRGICDK